MGNFFSKNFAVLLAITALSAAVLFFSANFRFAPQAGGLAQIQTEENSGFFKDLLNNLLRPFLERATESSVPVKTVPEAERDMPLYKPALDYERAVIEAVKRVSPAVVSITVSKNVPIIEQCPYNPFGGLPPQFRPFFDDPFFFSVPCERGEELREIGSGSGFIISADGLVITNKHVVFDKKASYTVFTNDGKKFNARVLALDPSLDLAVVKIDAFNLPVAALGDSSELELGQTAIAIGNALGEFRNTVSVGVISGLARNVTASGLGFGTELIQGVIQTDAAINPGNSGGPLLNLRGEVIGINTAVASGAENIGFAIPINQAKRAIDSVRRTGEIHAPYLGVRYFMITEELAKQQKLPVEYGALIRGSADGPGVIPGSPADKAGLRAEDIILEINGKRVDKDNPLGAIIAQFNVGETVKIRIRRGEREFTFTAVLEKRPAE